MCTLSMLPSLEASSTMTNATEFIAGSSRQVGSRRQGAR
jgi:hypothetical protein